MARKKKIAAATEFHTLKRIDNTRLVRNIEPVKLRSYYRASALGGLIALCFMFYIYQHFRCIDLSFQLEEARGKQADAALLNNSLKLQIADLSDPKRVDLVARKLGLTETHPDQVVEYQSGAESQVAAARFTKVSGVE